MNTAPRPRVALHACRLAVLRVAVLAVLLAVPGSVLLGTVTGSAAGLDGVQTLPVEAGSAAVTGCDHDGVTTQFSTHGGVLAAVEVSGIADPGCEGATLSVTVVDGADADLGVGSSVTVPADAGTADDTVVLPVSGPGPVAGQVHGIHVLIEGP